MGEWRRRGRIRCGAALIAGATVIGAAAGVAAPAPVQTAAVRLLGTTIGVGGSFDGFGSSVPLFFYGTAVPEGDSFHTVPYPAQINLNYPLISDLPVLSGLPYWPQSLKRSERVGAGYLEQDIARQTLGDKVTIIGMSQGAQVAEIARADMAKDPNYVANAQNYRFMLVGDPYQPNGGILARFTALRNFPILGDVFPLGRPGPSDSPFATTFYQNQYDGFADFPAYFNPPAILNALMGIVFQHVLPGYVLESRTAPNAVTTTVGNSTYVTYPQYLPLLAPLRLAASVIGAQRLVDALDPIVRVFVEMGYDRTADPSQVKQFSFGTPQQKIQQGLDQLPKAFAQSLAILGGARYTPTLPQPDVAATEPVTPVTEHPAIPVNTSPMAKALRQAVVNLAGGMTSATRQLAKVLQRLTGHAPARTGTGPVSTAAVGIRPVSTPTSTTRSEPASVAATATPSAAAAASKPIARQRPKLSRPEKPRERTAHVPATRDRSAADAAAGKSPKSSSATKAGGEQPDRPRVKDRGGRSAAGGAKSMHDAA